MSAAAHHHQGHDAPSEPESFLFEAWKAADTCVPWPFLLYWVAQPPRGARAATLRHLTDVEFVYGTPVDFVVLLGLRQGAFTQAVVERRTTRVGEFRLMPISGRQDLRLTPEKAEERIEIYLMRQDLRFWQHLFHETGEGLPEIITLELDLLLHRYRQLSWRSVRLERPLRAGVTEPNYIFRKAGCTCEFLVGVQTGNVTHRHVRDFTPPPVVNPPAPSASVP